MALLVSGLFFILSQITLAQQPGADSCGALVQSALSAVGSNCADLGPNAACYGFDTVSSILTQGVDDLEPLSKPADQIDITHVAVIKASGFDLRN